MVWEHTLVPLSLEHSLMTLILKQFSQEMEPGRVGVLLLTAESLGS